jgi:hypothetical protein
MVEIIQEKVGKLLYRVPKNYESLKFYPSPNKLKNKIIIKSKAIIDDIFNFDIP